MIGFKHFEAADPKCMSAMRDEPFEVKPATVKKKLALIQNEAYRIRYVHEVFFPRTEFERKTDALVFPFGDVFLDDAGEMVSLF